jgi:nitrile hydratase accessory protein
MQKSSLPAVLDVDGPAAPPRRNGELVFGAPWESRAFGLAMTLHAGGKFDWEDFRQELISVIGEWERDHGPEETWSYYRCWVLALERVLEYRGLVRSGDVESRTLEFATRPEGHDHRHEHLGEGHDHHHHHGNGHEGHAHSC